jgi:hypothetical protein
LHRTSTLAATLARQDRQETSASMQLSPHTCGDKQSLVDHHYL